MLKKYPVALYLTWIVVILVLPLPLIWLLNSQLIASPSSLFAYDMGIMAYVWWLIVIFLSTRPHWLEHFIGIPSMYFIHGSLGVLALMAATAHKFLSFSFDQSVKQTGNTAWYIAIAGIIYAILFMSGWLVDRYLLFRKAKIALSKIFNHQVSVWLHRANLLLIVLIWLHVHLIVRFSSMNTFMVTFDVYTYVVVGYYLLSKFLGMFKSNGTVIQNQELGPHTQQLIIKLDKNSPSYHAGDFYFLSFRGSKNISREKHPFSVTSAAKDNPYEVMFTIQKLGDFTRKISQVTKGTRCYLEGPYGRFNRIIEKLQENQPIILYGLGSGLAPLLSIAEQYGGIRPIRILWSTSKKNGLYFEKTLNRIKEQSPNISVLVKERRFTLEDLQRRLTSEEIKEAVYFVVGPSHVVIKIEKLLKDVGIASSQIIDERLTM